MSEADSKKKTWPAVAGLEVEGLQTQGGGQLLEARKGRGSGVVIPGRRRVTRHPLAPSSAGRSEPRLATTAPGGWLQVRPRRPGEEAVTQPSRLVLPSPARWPGTDACAHSWAAAGGAGRQ